VSVCCEVSVGLVQGCEWHWRIFVDAPVWYFFSLNQQREISPDSYSGAQPKQIPRYLYRRDQLSNHFGLPNLRTRRGPA